ncbi:MAG TPA: MFS transporter [Streptosporangiaceae bacterium]|nr:MFS transporter [Streptosporangiaceae bacterium]
MKAPAGGARGPAVSQRAKTIRLALILVAAFMMVLDFSIVNVALPSIERELGLSGSLADWVVTAYAIAFGGLLILGGRAADMLGRRRMFVIGLITFSLASLSGGLAQDPVLLLASRAVQGIGAAIVLPAALSLITTGFPEGRERTRALGLYGATASLGFVAGQVLGGVLVEFMTWRSVFLVNVPVGLLAALIAPRVLGRSANMRDARAGRRLDARGALLITAAVAFAVFAVSEGNVLGWLSPGVLAAAAASIAAGTGFVAAEQRHPEPLIRLGLLRHAGLRHGSTVTFLLGLWNGGEMLVLSIYLQQVLHFSPLAAGLTIAPQGVIGFLAGIYGPRLASVLGGVRKLIVVTAASAVAGFAVLTQLPASGYSPLLLAVTLVGFGTAGTAFGSIVIASHGMANEDQGLVGGMINTSRQIGAAVGAALLPAVAEGISRGGAIAGVSGDRAAMLTGGISAIAATVIAWRAARAVRAPAPAPRRR